MWKEFVHFCAFWSANVPPIGRQNRVTWKNTFDKFIFEWDTVAGTCSLSCCLFSKFLKHCIAKWGNLKKNDWHINIWMRQCDKYLFNFVHFTSQTSETLGWAAKWNNLKRDYWHIKSPSISDKCISQFDFIEQILVESSCSCCESVNHISAHGILDINWQIRMGCENPLRLWVYCFLLTNKTKVLKALSSSIFTFFFHNVKNF